MLEIARITLKGIFRDRIFQGIMVLAMLFLLIPTAATLSMRQPTELSITLSLSLISFILFLLAVFLGATSIWKDVERRYSYSVLSLPLKRSDYLLGRFFGIAAFLLLTAVFLGLVGVAVVYHASSLYPPARPLIWEYLILATGFEVLRYILLVAVGLLLSTVSTSFFLPIFGTIAIYWVGSFSQDVYNYLNSSTAESISPLVRESANFLYYVLPNFSAFDYKVNAIYALTPDTTTMLMSCTYFVVYTGVVLSVAVIVLIKKELR